MSFASERFIPSAIYSIIGVERDSPIAFGLEDYSDKLVASPGSAFEWKVTQLTSIKWIIESDADGRTATLPPNMEEGDHVEIQAAGRIPQRWVIKRRAPPDPQDCYIIYTPEQNDLFWNLPNGNDTTVRFALGDKAKASWWKFKKLRDIDTIPPDIGRPTLNLPVVGNSIKIYVPPKWFAMISAVSIGDCINLIRVNRRVNGLLDVQSFQSTWDSKDQAMTVTDRDLANSLPILAEDATYSLVLDFFHSTNPQKLDPQTLPKTNDVSTNLRVISMERPSEMRNFPDYQTFWIFDENANDGSRNAIVVIQLTKDEVDLINPVKPPPGTVNEGYNPVLDGPRPGDMFDYLGKYDIIFLVDDSGSMAGNRWSEVREALAEVGNEAMQYDADGVQICFLNSPLNVNNVGTREAVLRIFDQVKPNGSTPTGRRLEQILGEITNTLDNAVNTPAYSEIKPYDVIVLTDGKPTDNPLPILEAAAARLTKNKHHPNAVGIQFLQIGNDDGAEAALQALVHGNVRNMVDTVPYTKNFTPERMKRVLLGAVLPIIRASMRG